MDLLLKEFSSDFGTLDLWAYKMKEKYKKELFPQYYNYPTYKGIYYKYYAETDVWVLYRDFISGQVEYYNGEYYRIDQCLEHFLNNENGK